MSGDRPNPLERLITTAEAIQTLLRLFAAEEPLEEVLRRIAATAAGAIPHADAVSITVLSEPEPHTVATPRSGCCPRDRGQYASGKGPCPEAATLGTPVRTSIDPHLRRWPEFLATAEHDGVRATLSVPLIVEELDPSRTGTGALVGSLNVYSRTAAAFDSFDEELMTVYTTAASHAISNAQRWQRARDTTTQLQQALISRAVIDQAKGALRWQHGYTAEKAFAALVERSQRRNVKLHLIAQEVLQQHQ